MSSIPLRQTRQLSQKLGDCSMVLEKLLLTESPPLTAGAQFHPHPQAQAQHHGWVVPYFPCWTSLLQIVPLPPDLPQEQCHTWTIKKLPDQLSSFYWINWNSAVIWWRAGEVVEDLTLLEDYKKLPRDVCILLPTLPSLPPGAKVKTYIDQKSSRSLSKSPPACCVSKSTFLSQPPTHQSGCSPDKRLV